MSKRSTFVPKILLPKKGINLQKWAVVACDQYTSEPEYWAEVKSFVGETPSTLNLVFPEVYLEDENDDEEARIKNINETMEKYLKSELEEHEKTIYLERTIDGKKRKGLIVAIDLENYDFNKGSKSKIRATEGTIIDRLPPRIKVRKDAALELPHIMLLIDDPEKKIIEKYENMKNQLEKAYDFDLMMDSGHLEAYFIEDPIIDELENLVDQNDEESLLYAVGDGNHSLATAKAIWEKLKEDQGFENVKDNPARYALVEVVNVHDDGLEFEPIHRVLFELKDDFLEKMKENLGENFKYSQTESIQKMKEIVDNQDKESHKIGVIFGGEYGVIEVSNPNANLAVGTLQNFIDEFMKKDGAKTLDYIHGLDVTERLGKEKGNIGFYLPAMDKNDLFKTVILDGSLPRKTFSMGEAKEKRFYMEARKIK